MNDETTIPPANSPCDRVAVPFDAPAVPSASTASRAATVHLVAGFLVALDALREEQTHLDDLDAVGGDGDHGAGMVRGCAAALEAAESAAQSGAGAGWTLSAAGEAWADESGGASGILWGGAVRAAAAVLGDQEFPDTARIAHAAQAFADALAAHGGASVGEKTMLDAVVPFVQTLRARVRAGDELPSAWQAAAELARAAADRSSEYGSQRGRSRFYGERSIGTPDPGAYSFALVVSALGPER